MWLLLVLTCLSTWVGIVLQVMLLAEIGKLKRQSDQPAPKPEEPATTLKPGTTWIPSASEQARKERLFAQEGDRRKWTVGAPKSGFRSGLPPS